MWGKMIATGLTSVLLSNFMRRSAFKRGRRWTRSGKSKSRSLSRMATSFRSCIHQNYSQGQRQTRMCVSCHKLSTEAFQELSSTPPHKLQASQLSLRKGLHQVKLLGNVYLEQLLLRTVCPFQISLVVLKVEAPRRKFFFRLTKAGELSSFLRLLGWARHLQGRGAAVRAVN